eukprot:TRINITY_DN11941_c0_g2_i1.p1 TRINITY_DN11941_c0_g2~~TRINITY_DN11941_c0_g2_i1.p1  ORF type:complete len:313 (-),score=-15.70 TRINITY_DN11941_c0_g2_i1:100-1038(-)
MAQPKCMICFGDLKEPFTLEGVSHDICTSCLKEYLQFQISIGDVISMKCPHCKQNLTDQDILSLVGEESLQKAQRIRHNKLIAQDLKKRWCPKPGCESIIDITKVNGKTGTCATCNTVFCAKCTRQPHEGSCTEIILREFDPKRKIKITICPKCLVPVEKTRGCNLMSCNVCGTEFCWLCGKTTNYEHLIDPLACSGYSWNKRLDMLPLWAKLFLGIFLLLLLPLWVLILIIVPPYLLTIEMMGMIRIEKMFCLTKAFLWIFFFILFSVINIFMLPYYLIVILAGILRSVCEFIGKVIRSFCRRSNAQRSPS